MADEVTVNFSMQFAKGESKVQIPSKQFKLDSASQVKIGNTQTIGTTHEALTLGDVASPGATFVLNTDSTNYVEIGVQVTGTFYPLITVPAGEMAFVPRWGTTSIYAKANTASCNLEYFMCSQ